MSAKSLIEIGDAATRAPILAAKVTALPHATRTVESPLWLERCGNPPGASNGRLRDTGIARGNIAATGQVMALKVRANSISPIRRYHR